MNDFYSDDLFPKRSLTKSELISYKKGLVLTDIQREVLVGTLLGDASISFRKKVQKPVYNVKFEQGIMHKDYVYHLYDIFQNFTGSPPSLRWIDAKKTRQSCWFRTYRHDEFIPYWHSFYEVRVDSQTGLVERVKVVPQNIEQLLTPRGLAHWFMDDGSFTKYANGEKCAFPLNTQNFTYEENCFLAEVLHRKFGLQVNVHKDKDKWRLYITSQSRTEFLDIIRPYIHKNFDYKV